MDTINLPDGHSAMMRESLAKTPRKYVRAIEEAKMRSTMVLSQVPKELLNADGDIEAHELVKAVAALPAESQATFLGMNGTLKDLQIVALVSEWSYPFPISIDSLGELPADAYDVLAAEAEERSKFAVDEATLAAMADPTQRLGGSLV